MKFLFIILISLSSFANANCKATFSGEQSKVSSVEATNKLFEALKENNKTEIDLYIEQADMQAKNTEGQTLGHVAIAHNVSAEIFQKLIDLGIDTKEDAGRSLLDQATQYNRTEIVKKLIVAGDKEATEKLFAAVKNKEEFDRFIKRVDLLERINIQAKNPEGQNLGHIAISHKMPTEVLQKLIDLGLDKAATDKNKNSLLHLATEFHQLETAEFLIKEGANVNARNDLGDSPTHIAVRENQIEILEMLGKAGANFKRVNNKHNAPIHTAITYGNIDTLEVLRKFNADFFETDNYHKSPVELVFYKSTSSTRVKFLEKFTELKHNIDLNFSTGDSAAHLAARHGDEAVLRALHKAGRKLDSYNGEFLFPANVAIKNGHINILKLLKELDVNISLFVIKYGESIVHTAARYNRPEVIELLKEWNFTLTDKNGEGQTPAEVAFNRGSTEALEALHKAGVSNNINTYTFKSWLKEKFGF